ncbi:MAG: TonB-dependent receptor [Pseudomonadales bacterium]|nr:TonB-dependent receptor [Pseudomonadales bacterium]
MSHNLCSRFSMGAIFAVTAGLLITPAAAAEEQGRVIEEVLVTAEKRTASVQETSIAVTAYSHEELELRGIDEIEDLQFSAPNLVISHNSQSPVTYAYIRGIGSDQLVAGFDPGVAYHVDGVYIGQPSSMPVDLWDMERIEVLRGPQGTLYGRNTTGGTINVITKGPTDELDGTFDVTAGNYDRLRLRGAVGGPIIGDRVSGRLSFISDSADGYQDNYIGDDSDAIDHWALRGKLRFDITEDLSLLLTAQRFENEGNQSQKRREPFEAVELAPGFVVNIFDGAIPNPSDPREVAKDHEEKLDLDNDFYSARVEWNLGNVTLVSTTAYLTNDWYQSTDIDMSSNAVQFQEWEMETNQFTQELQLISSSEGPLQWILGAFWFDEDLETDYFFQDSSVAGFNFFNGGDLDTKSWAVYGQASWDMRDSGVPLRIVGGLRYTEDEKKIDEYQIIPEFLLDLSGDMDNTWDETTGKLGIDWFLSDDIMAYASYSHGYKGGGYSVGQFDEFDPETVDNFEVGLKTLLADGKAQVNVAAFYNDYQDLQVNYLLGTLYLTYNAAEATIQGIEIESTLLVTDQFMIGANFTWLDAEFDEYIFDPGPPEIDLAGDRLNRAPEYTVALTAQYDFSIEGIGNFSARADYYWQDDMYLRLQNTPRHEADAFDTVDLRLVWTSLDEHWTIDAFMKNAGNEDNQRSLTVNDGLSSGTASFVSYYPPKTYGVRFGYSLGN